MPPTPRLLLPASLALLALAPPAAASEADVPTPGATYALVIGSNRPGPGQRALRFADQDAAAMAEVLTHAGGLDADHLVRLADPDAEALLHALDGLGGPPSSSTTPATPGPRAWTWAPRCCRWPTCATAWRRWTPR